MNKLENIISQLKETEPIIKDESFTSDVIMKIPQIYELPLWKKNLILLLATCLGSGISVWALPLENIFLLMTNSAVFLPLIVAITIAIYTMSFLIVREDQSFKI